MFILRICSEPIVIKYTTETKPFYSVMRCRWRTVSAVPGRYVVYGYLIVPAARQMAAILICQSRYRATSPVDFGKMSPWNKTGGVMTRDLTMRLQFHSKWILWAFFCGLRSHFMREVLTGCSKNYGVHVYVDDLWELGEGSEGETYVYEYASILNLNLPWL